MSVASEGPGKMASVFWCGNVCWIYTLYSFPLLRFNCFHPNYTISLQTHINVKCDFQTSAEEPQDETNSSLMQAVNFHCTWPAYLELTVSLEFDNPFRPQICATYEMCLGILLRQAMETIMAHSRAISPNFSQLCFKNFWLYMKRLWGKNIPCNIKVVYLVPQLIL